MSASSDLGRPLVYRHGDSRLHRLPGGLKLAAVALASAAAVAARSPWALAALAALVAGGYAAAGLGLRALREDALPGLAQLAIVVGLYTLRDGLPEGLGPGLRTGVQILLFFLPGALLFRTTDQGALLASLERVLPRRLAFVTLTSLRFAPLLAKEVHEIVLAQRLRGAELSVRRAWRPRFWHDCVACVAVPAVVRALKTAGEAALTAESRGLVPREGGPS